MNENIEYYYNLLQENILIVEDDEENKSALEAVTTNYKAVHEYIKMFLISQKERYYGYFLMDMELHIDYYFSHEAAVNMDTIPFSLIVNPLLLGKCTIKEMIFIICHEIEHIVLEHPAEATKINHNMDPWEHVALNYAMDASVNDRLRMEVNKYKLNIMAPPDDDVTSGYLSDEYDVELDELQDFLYYYEKIVEYETQIIENNEVDRKNTQEAEVDEPYEDYYEEETEDENESIVIEAELSIPSTDDDDLSLEEWLEKLNSAAHDPLEDFGKEDESFWDDVDETMEESNKKPSRRNKSNPKKESGKILLVLGAQSYPRIITAKNRPAGISLHKWTDIDFPDEIREQIRQYVQRVVDGIPDEMRGLLPDYQQLALAKALEKPAIKWENVLRKYIGTIPNGYRKTRTRLDRRQPERFDISGRISRRTIDIVVAIDTSASMSPRLLEKIFNEIFTILKSREYHLTIIECDAEIQRVYEAKSMDDVDLEVYGCGGTSFIPVIEYVNERKEFRKSLLIYFTDGMGDDYIPYPQVYRMLWVLPTANREMTTGFVKPEDAPFLSVREPYGDIISMNIE